MLTHRPRGYRLSVEPGRQHGTGYRRPDPKKAAPGGASTPTEGLTTRSDYLLMANENPTDGHPAATLTIPAGNVSFLRPVIAAARDGLQEDLDRFAGQLREPASQLRAEIAAYGQLLHALDGGPITLNKKLRDTLARFAETIDDENEYARVVAEHEAIHGLLAQLREVAA